MRAKDEDQFSPVELDYIAQPSSRKPRISYTREFLLSLSELDICQKLPEGFDPAILSDFGENSNSVPPERPRILGSLSAQNFRRCEYGSSPPTRGDSANYFRATHGRWDTRSSGSNDRDSDTQLDWESDAGKRYGNHSRRSWQNSEHDGLLGSGAFPRPTGSGPGASAVKGRGNGYQLSKSNEPYQPPRPYKAVPHSRREDSINDETFGSSEVSSQDRVNEERKRRASFEQFRKEQKEFHEKQKQFPDKRKESIDPDITALLADSENDKKLWDKSNESEDSTPTISQSDTAKCSFPMHTTASRPLVPPGFTSTAVLEKNYGTKSFAHSALEVGDVGFDSNIAHAKGDAIGNGISDTQADKKSESIVESSQMQYENNTNPIPVTDLNEKIVTRSSDLRNSGSSVSNVSPSQGFFNLSETYQNPSSNVVTDFDDQRVLGHDAIGTAGPEHSTSILEKLFGKASTVNSGGSSFIEDGDAKVDEAGSNTSSQSSKFSHWFLEEEKRPTDDLLSTKSTDLLSLIVGGEKGVSQISDEKASVLPVKGNDLLNRFITPSTASATGANGEPFLHSNAPNATAGVLTCEDLEQSILSEISEKSSNMLHPKQPSNSSNAKAEHAKADVDNHASQHLLSLLKKDMSTKDPASSPNLGVFSEDLHVYEPRNGSSVVNKSTQGNSEIVKDGGKSLTLETLFGSSFMNALHSVDAPVSVHRGSISGVTRSDVLEPQGFPFRVADDGFFPGTSDNTILKGDAHVPNHTQQTKSNNIEEHWLGYDTRIKLATDLNKVGATTKGRDGEELEFQLPEEESLITVGDPVISRHSMIMPVADATKNVPASFASTPIDIADKLASLNASFRSERSALLGLDGLPFRRGPFDPMEPEIPVQNLHGRSSSPQFTHMQMNHGRPLFQPSDSHHTHPQVKYMGQDHPELAPHHHFPANVLRAPSFQAGPGRPTRFDPAQHPILQQMHMPGNLLPSHLQQGLPRGPHMPPYPVKHMAGYVPEINPMQGFPFGHRQQSYGGPEMPMPGPGGVGGSNHPEALEKLFEMELRANLKQLPPPVTGTAQGFGNSHGIDMGFRYR